MDPLHPTIEVPYFITRQFIQKHKEWFFVYSDDLNGQHYFGQAAHCKGESNCASVPVKRVCCMDESRAFFDDKRFELLWKPAIDKAIKNVVELARSRPIVPFPRIGQGQAELPKRAPETYKYLMAQLNNIAYPNIQWINPI